MEACRGTSTPTVRHLARFREQVAEHFRLASGPSVRRRDIVLGGESIRLEFATESVERTLLPALAHLERPPHSAPELTISVWDQAGSGVSLPASPFSPDDYGPRREVRRRRGQEDSFYFDVWSGVFSMLDADARRGYWWTQDIDRLADYECAAPLRTILQRWFERPTSQFVHAAAVGGEKGALLLAGPGGAGKSTTALACARAGLGLLGEDYCLVQATEKSLRVHLVFSSAKISPSSPAWDTDYEPLTLRARGGSPEKHVLFLYPARSDLLISSAPIRAILLPRVTGARVTTLSETSPMAALRALAPSTLLQLAGAGQGALDLMATLVERVPVMTLHLGRDMEQLVDVISGLLESTSSDA